MTANFRQNLTFPSGGAEAHGYLALPPGGSGPGVLVAHEWWGLTDQIAGIAEQLAAEGYVALAVDLYDGQVTSEPPEALKLMTSVPLAQGTARLADAVDFLLAHEAVTGESLGAVGYSMGGGYVLVLAAQAGAKLSTVVSYYGVVNGQDPDFSGVKAKVLGHFGEQDAFVPTDRAHQLTSAVRDQSGTDVQLLLYPRGHSFANEQNLLGTYDKGDGDLAWERTLAFLKAGLG
jgi:carboxymethylenebutenolidase